MAFLRGQNLLCLPTAHAALAASLMDGGSTSHRLFKLPVPIFDNSSSRIQPFDDSAKLLKETAIFVWDEVTTAHKFAFECVDRLLKQLMSNQYPFGGKVFLFCGDFRQTLPVVKHGTASEIIAASIKKSYLWQQINPNNKFQLTQNMRANANQNNFKNFLMEMGNGSLPTHDNNNEQIELPQQCLIPENDSLIDYIFGKTINIHDISVRKKAILCPKNDARLNFFLIFI